MTDTAEQLEQWTQAIANTLTPETRRNVLRDIARSERRNLQKNITAQRSPDGKQWEPRKPRARDKTGQIKKRKKMFLGMRRVKHLRIVTKPEKAEIGYKGRLARIATVHQLGKIDRVEKGGPLHRYAKRQLLGVTDPDAILEKLITAMEDAAHV